MSSRTLLLRSLVIMALMIGIVSATDYYVAAILPQTGSTDPLRQLQWKQVATYAASEVTAQWNDGDRLLVDVQDSKNQMHTAISLAAAATSNASVMAVVTGDMDDDFVAEMSRLVQVYNLPLVAIGTTSSDLEADGSNTFFSVNGQDENIPDLLIALLARHQWTKIAILHDESFSEVNERIRAEPSLSVLSLSLETTASVDIFKALISQSVSVNIILTTNATMVSSILSTAANVYALYDYGNAWVVAGIDEASLPSLPPVGTIFVDIIDIPSSNLTSFTTLVDSIPGTSGTLETLTGHIYDAVKLIGEAIKSTKPSVNRANVVNAIASINHQGVTGYISFNPSTGFRLQSMFSIWNSVVPQPLTNASLVRSLDWNGSAFTALTALTFPGPTTAVPDSTVEIYTLVYMVSISSTSTFSIAQRSSIIKYPADVVNGNIMASYPTPKLPAGYKLRIAAVSIGNSDQIAIPATTPLPDYGVLAVLSETSSSTTQLLQNILSPYGIIQASSAATSPLLSNKVNYPTFVRDVAPDDFQGKGLIDLCMYYGWTEIGIIYSSDTYGTGIFQTVQQNAFDRGVTISSAVSVDVGPTDYTETLRAFANVAPRVVLMLQSGGAFRYVMKSLKNLNYKAQAYVASDAITYTFSNLAAYGLTAADIDGFVATNPSGGYGPNYDAFLADITAMGNTSLLNQYVFSTKTGSSLLYDNVFMYADAMNRLITAGVSPNNKTALLQAIYATTATFLTGPMTFNANGDRIGAYDLLNYYNGQTVTAGRLTPGVSIALNAKLVWPDGTTNVPLAVLPRHQKWLMWTDPAAIIFSILAALGIVTCLVFTAIMVQQKESPVIRVATWEFLLVMMFGCALGYGSMFTWIGKPHPYICALRIWLPPMAFILIMAPLLTKTWRLWRIFSLRDMKVQPILLSRLVILCCILGGIQLIICIFWIAMGTIQPAIINDANDKTISYVVCGANKANRIAAYVTYGYLGFLMLVGCYLTFRARKLPKDFNETRWIGFSIYNTLLFSIIILILGYALNKFPVTILILSCVCTFAIATGAIAFMMAPKLWTLLLHPEKRSSGGSNSTHKSPNASKYSKDYSRTNGSAGSKGSKREEVPTAEL